MKFKDCVLRGYYEEDGTHIIELSMDRIVYFYRNKEMPSLEDTIFFAAEELQLKKPFKIIFVEGEREKNEE
jgi:hypothetical protein